MTADGSYTLLVTKGAGSAIVEALMDLSGIRYSLDDVNYEIEGPGLARLRAKNPLGQVPTLVMPDGSIMTESAAMVLHFGDIAPEAGLVPKPADPERPRFLRYLMVIVASIYPTFSYGDDVAQWVTDKAAGEELRVRTNARREMLWQAMEGEIAPDPWLLGTAFSALDVYVAVMTHWRPRRAWFEKTCPKLFAIATRVDALPGVQKAFARNFG